MCFRDKDFFMQNLIADLQNTAHFSDSDLEKVLPYFSVITFGKDDKMPSYGKTVQYFKFIDSGVLDIYFIDKNAKKTTVQIGVGKAWINDLYSFLTQTPCQYHVDVLDKTTIYQIHKADLEKLFIEVPAMEQFFHLKIRRVYLSLQERTVHQINQSAEERYQTFRENYGYIEPLVPQYIIASYLNISPEHLSKIRRLMAKK